MAKAKTSDRTRGVRRVAKILRDGGYSYDQSKHLIAQARRAVGLTSPQRKKGSVERLTREELDALLGVAYASSGVRGLMIRTLLETGSRVGAFSQLRGEDLEERLPPPAAPYDRAAALLTTLSGLIVGP